MRPADRLRWAPDRCAALTHMDSRRFLMDEGLPKRSLLFTSVEPISKVAAWVQGPQRYVVLGNYTDDESFVLDMDAGTVHFGTGAGDPVWPVNSGLRKFVRCLDAAEGEFPFYGAGAGVEEYTRVSTRLKALVRHIDPTCFAAEGSFWASLLHDISIGDFSTEDVDWWPSAGEK
ncbi:hypothetical protein GCM10011579_086800 [Streptomyces albiflavescens]|uniref:SUKH-4 immunity protein of toxin-antitoxin system n=1 Tax=Streptomyces albiflavescens TaxID=1623582 RepID=A0A917YE54_9ACTN|nr:SUKH-4 family immunity protein [Streptomyces albiflavescens]GGN90661.1 hypothetical protein GCM10011579_086800 [Streptomyces albiflavescens]